MQGSRGGLPKGWALPGSISAAGRREERDGPATWTLRGGGQGCSALLPFTPKWVTFPEGGGEKKPSRSPCFVWLFWGEVGKNGKRSR